MCHQLVVCLLLVGGLAIAEIVGSLAISTCADDQPDVHECRRQALQQAVPFLANGLPQINAAPIAPLDQLPPLSWHSNSRGLDVNFRLDNGRITGFGHSIVDNLEVDTVNNRIRIVSHVEGAHTVEGAYTMAGHVLGVPMDGNGLFKLTHNGGTVDVTYAGHNEIRGGQSYLKLDSVHVKLALGVTQYELTGLFGDYQPLVHAGNMFINSIASSTVEPDMLPTLEKWLAEAFHQRAQAVFSAVPYDQLFPKTSAHTGFYRAVFPHYF